MEQAGGEEQHSMDGAGTKVRTSMPSTGHRFFSEVEVS